MSLKKTGEVKKDKGFKIWDLLVYGVLIAIIAAVFIAVFVTRDTSPLKGIRIYSDNALVLEYNFENNEYGIFGENVVVLSDSDGALEVKVFYGKEFNTVYIDKSGSVKVTDADCLNRTCIAMNEIKNNGGMIYCSPHRLRIEPYEYVPDNSVII